jgi:general secretion pathway protein I
VTARHEHRSGGFTLIEVLVALAIAALGLAAVLSVVSNSARDAAALRERTLASWIAINHLTEVRLAANMPAVDRTTGELDYAGGHWKWEQTVTQTDVPTLRRIDVRVRKDTDPDDATRATITGFVGHTQLSAPRWIVNWDGQSAGPNGGTGATTPVGTTPNTPGAPTAPGAPVTPVTPGLPQPMPVAPPTPGTGTPPQ